MQIKIMSPDYKTKVTTKTGNTSLENVINFKYLRTTIVNQNCIQEGATAIEFRVFDVLISYKNRLLPHPI
jgi:hypothetical protein